MMMIFMKRKQLEWLFEWKLKGVEEMLALKRALLTVKQTFAVVLDNDDNANLGSHIVSERCFLHATADFEAGFNGAGTE